MIIIFLKESTLNLITKSKLYRNMAFFYCREMFKYNKMLLLLFSIVNSDEPVNHTRHLYKHFEVPATQHRVVPYDYYFKIHTCLPTELAYPSRSKNLDLQESMELPLIESFNSGNNDSKQSMPLIDSVESESIKEVELEAVPSPTEDRYFISWSH